MDNIEETEILELEETSNDIFINNMNSILSVKRDYEKNEYDYEWIDKIEETLPYIDNILRNPKRFIINEEEVVKVEKSKKVTVESIIHLTQHTNYIQKIDENGDVKPSQILNINKEESLDTYENRFIYTLINNTRTFFEKRKELTGETSYFSDKKNLKYEANTIVGTEDIEVSLQISSVNKAEIENQSPHSSLTVSERLKNIKMQLDGFTGTELMQTLSKLHVSPVRSPIRKTNVILKNPNFQAAERLWNYVQSYEEKNVNESDKKDYYDQGELKKEYDKVFLMTYIANRSLDEKEGSLTEQKVLSQMFVRLIDNILDSGTDITEEKIKEIFNHQLKLIKKRNEEKKKIIKKFFIERITKENEEFSKKIQLLEGESI